MVSTEGDEHHDETSKGDTRDRDDLQKTVFGPEVENDSSSASSSTPAESTVRKRKARDDQSSNDGRGNKRRLLPYNNHYRELLNEQIQEVAIGKLPNGYASSLPPSQIGATYWSSEEKEGLFAALGRMGRVDVRGIACRVGTKSELEVSVYLSLLQRGFIEKTLTEPKQQLLGITDIPAAVDISQDCCTALEAAAESLENRQGRYESQVEKKKWQHLWLLTAETATWVEAKLEEGEKGNDELKDSLPAAALLNLRNWLELSSRMFMNSSNDDENWALIADKGEQPSIRHAAFADFYTLAVSLTKRLLQAALFHAMSRLRAMDSSVFHRLPVVTAADVHVACQVLGMKEDSDEFWIKAARRCGLKVYDWPTTRSPSDSISLISCDEAEKRLSTRGRKWREGMMDASLIDQDLDDVWAEEGVDSLLIDRPPARPSSPSTDSDDTAVSQEWMPGGNIQGTLSTSFEDGAGPIEQPNSRIAEPHKREGPGQRRLNAQIKNDDEQDAYAEAFDQRASALEEERLWQILEESPPPLARPDGQDMSPKPRPGRKDASELLDWRDGTECWAEWETLKTLVPAQDFDRARRQRGRSPPASRSVEGLDEVGSDPEVPGKHCNVDSERDLRIAEHSASDVSSSSSSTTTSNPSAMSKHTLHPAGRHASSFATRADIRRSQPLEMVATAMAVAKVEAAENGDELANVAGPLMDGEYSDDEDEEYDGDS